MSAICIIQARLSSERFPRKILADLHGKPMLAHVVERALQIRGIDRVIVAVPWQDAGDIAHALAQHIDSDVSISASRRETADVLGRFVDVAENYPEADSLMRLTGDCPMIEPVVCERVLARYRSVMGCEYCWTDTHSDEWPDGLDCEVFSRRLLMEAHNRAIGEDREHVTPLMRRLVVPVTLPPDANYQRWAKCSVDTPADLAHVAAVMR